MVQTQTIDYKIPILMYHEVAEEEKIKQICRKTPRSLVLTPQQFETQMAWLRQEGFGTLSLYDLIAILHNRISNELPAKAIVITFDDGFEGNYQNALPILRQYEFSATFFVVVNKVGTPLMMNWRQLEEMTLSGMSIQSHTMSHPLLGSYDFKQIMYELEESKKKLQERLQISIDFLSLPFGSYNKHYKDAAIAAGYSGGCTSKIGLFLRSSDSYFLHRIVVNSNKSFETFKMLANADAKLIAKIAFKQKYKNLIRRSVGEKFYNKAFNLIYGIER